MSLAFTTQQLMGGSRYTPGIKIGNWNEDIARQEVAARDYENRRANGQLLHLKKQQERNFQVQPVPHTYCVDGLVRFGDNIMLSIYEGKEKRYLGSNVFMKTSTNGSRVTAGSNAHPQARSVFVLMRPGAHPGEVLSATGRGAAAPRDEDVLLYGDRIVLGCSPYLVAEPTTGAVGIPLVLTSSKASIALGNTRKGMQEVVMSSTRGPDSDWTIVHSSGDRLATDGTPVQAGDDFELIHSMSNVPLAAVHAEQFPTDFGTELEVHCMAYKGTSRSSMNKECMLPHTPANRENRWKFEYAASKGASVPVGIRELAPLTPDSVMAKARALMSKNLGPHAVRSFNLALAALDARSSGSVPREAGKLALYDHGAVLSDEEFAMLFSGLTGSTTVGRSAQANLLPTRGLLEAVRMPEGLSEGRMEEVQAAYAHLTSTAGGGPVTFAHLKSKYDGKWDPRVVAGTLPGAPKYGGMTAVESNAEFARQWPAHRKASDTVTLAQFTEYYTDVSACFEDDWAFSTYVSNVWHMPGKGNWKGKAGLKVHVDFHNGSSTDAIIPGGEDLYTGDDERDYEGLAEALAKLGMGGVARVKVVSVVEQE